MTSEKREGPGPDFVEVDGIPVRAGSRVRLSPRDTGADVFERALEGRTGIVQEIIADDGGRIELAVTIIDDPVEPLGAIGPVGRSWHRLRLDPLEVQPLDSVPAQGSPSARVLVAGIGNPFLGDDGWGVALAARLAACDLPPGVEVVDFGIRGMDLAYAMQDGYAAVVLLDATPRGGPAGTLYVVEPDLDELDTTREVRGMSPERVLALALSLGGSRLPRTVIVGCEPQRPTNTEEEFVAAELTAPVSASLKPAVGLVEELLVELTARSERRL